MPLRTWSRDKTHGSAGQATGILRDPTHVAIREADKTHGGRMVTELRGRPVPVRIEGTARICCFNAFQNAFVKGIEQVAGLRLVAVDVIAKQKVKCRDNPATFIGVILQGLIEFFIVCVIRAIKAVPVLQLGNVLYGIEIFFRICARIAAEPLDTWAAHPQEAESLQEAEAKGL